MKTKYKVLMAVIGCSLGLIGGLIYFKQDRCAPIRLEFLRSNVPVIQIQIEGKVFPLMFDTGSKFPLSLLETDLALIGKVPGEAVEWRDWKGDRFQADAYMIPKIKLGRLEFKDVLVKSGSSNCKKNHLFIEDEGKKEKIGIIGRPILEKSNLLLDFPNSVAYPSQCINEINSYGYQTSEFFCVPLEINKFGMVVDVATDLGVVRLSIDTGSTFTVLRRNEALDGGNAHEPQFLASQSFTLGGVNLGPVNVCLADFSKDADGIEGVLGMDFLKKRVIYIDYKNKNMWIQKNEKD